MLDIAILDGVRTPFAKAYGPLASVSAQELGRQSAVALFHKAGIAPGAIDQTVFGNVATPVEAANISRVIALTAGVPQDRPAHTVGRNCASGVEALTTAAQLILVGDARVVLAGGTESMSQIPLLYNRLATEAYLRLGKAKGLWGRLSALLRFRPKHFKPVIGVQKGLTDPVSGLIMGETAEVLAEEWGITRLAQDEYALRSHHLASAAQMSGRLAEEIVPVTADGKEVREDVGLRPDQTLEALAKLKPFFKKDGTVTVGNSSMITDGAAALLVAPGEWARSEGRTPLGYLRAYAHAGCDPARMGLGPAYATAKLLAKTGLSLREVDIVELNEAFAAVVLANEKAFASAEFARKALGRGGALGELDPERLNVNGGAIALGHPVGATGARLVLTALKELHRRKGRYALVTLCVGGGQGSALLLEAA